MSVRVSVPAYTYASTQAGRLICTIRYTSGRWSCALSRSTLLALYRLYICSISASPTACLSLGYRRVGTQSDRFGLPTMCGTWPVHVYTPCLYPGWKADLYYTVYTGVAVLCLIAVLAAIGRNCQSFFFIFLRHAARGGPSGSSYDRRAL